MSNIDERLRKSLSSEDQAFLAELDTNGSFHQDLAAAFQGHMRWLNALGLFFGLALFIVAVFCGWRFVIHTDLRSMLLWGAGAGLACLGLAMIKLWFWLELKTNSIVREIKRVELQVASLRATAR
jgi:hypothetical protein